MTTELKFDKLTSDVDWQLESLRTYIRKGFMDLGEASPDMLPSEIVVQNVLKAYLCLTEKFYDQFNAQLKEAYEQKSISDTEVAVLLQQALNKLTAEWERVYGFITATKATKTSETDKIIAQLSPLIRAAVRDAGFSPDSFPVVPHFGTVYNLGFFNYTDDFMALNLPITALQSPWEWTIFWHEIAGQKIRLLKKTKVEFLNALSEYFVEMKLQQKLSAQQALDLGPSQDKEKSREVIKEEFKEEGRVILASLLAWLIPSYPSSRDQYSEKEAAFLEALIEGVYQDWNRPDALNSSFTHTKELIQDLSSKHENLPLLMFSFDDLLDEIMEDLRKRTKTSVTDTLWRAHQKSLQMKKKSTGTTMQELIDAWAQALSLEDTLATQKKMLMEEGWSADWLEELFEDSFSVMNFDINFLPIFDNLLRRYTDGGKDMRHPPHYIRLASAAALQLLKRDKKGRLIKQDEPPQADKLPNDLSRGEKIILKRYYSSNLGAESQAVVWMAAKKFHAMQQRLKIPYTDSDQTVEQAKKEIADAMKANRDELGTFKGKARIAAEILSKLAAMTSDSQTKKGVTAKSENQLVLSNYEKKIDTLLQSRNIIGYKTPLGYRDLLDLSFYNVDFLGTTITDVRVNGVLKYSKIQPMKALSAEVRDQTLHGPVTYKVDGNDRGTTMANWKNDPALSGYGL